MNDSESLSWPSTALSSVSVLYRDLQDIQIFVEDSYSEQFYLELLGRIVKPKIRIRKIICLQGRESVISYCKNDKGDFPVLYIIDGDLDIVTGKKLTMKNLYQLKVYCIENYLFCESASREIIRESCGKKASKDIFKNDEWSIFQKELRDPLSKLFITFGAARVLAPSLKTVSYGGSKIGKQKSKKRGIQIDEQKVEELILEIEQAVVKECSYTAWNSVKNDIEQRIKNLKDFSYISAKDYILPFLRSFLLYHGAQSGITNSSLCFRLARHCSVASMDELASAIESAI